MEKLVHRVDAQPNTWVALFIDTREREHRGVASLCVVSRIVTAGRQRHVDLSPLNYVSATWSPPLTRRNSRTCALSNLIRIKIKGIIIFMGEILLSTLQRSAGLSRNQPNNWSKISSKGVSKVRFSKQRHIYSSYHLKSTSCFQKI